MSKYYTMAQSKELNFTITDIFTYNNRKIHIIADIHNVWFYGINILEILEYKISYSIILNRINYKYKNNIQNIFKNKQSEIDSANQIYINEFGLYQLCLTRNTESVIKFREYIWNVLLPYVRTHINQRYVLYINKQKTEIEELKQKLI
ncbi:putative antirepressor [Alphaentomopoxvirus acuprea]|uniref:Putative antirepressor n=1 Tax=Alphaentomopoxvirus acuprea TaxID=62099 RepID=W6JL69_9POXV|nr:putative antirepressor [Anomala cuprea entomopoxvirus]YP_009001726.1 putative antirepressor [Anomala cuprea entomopoxvirus]BAO49371.1 putative antirepressor [Anomala cuprea entomopoxvirus]BAO49613.1 putative antirepressor [Anomala cuprea entomopoxvirus]